MSTLDDLNVPAINDAISEQRWSLLKTLIPTSTSPSDLLHHLLLRSSSGPLLLLPFLRRTFHHQPVTLLSLFLHSLLSKLYSHARSVLLLPFSPPSLLHSLSVSPLHRPSSASILADMLVLQLSKSSRADSALESFHRSCDYGYKLSSLSCNTLLNLLIKNGRIDDAETIFKVMVRRKFAPNLITINTVINGFCKAGKLRRAVDLVEDMKAWKISPSVVFVKGVCANVSTYNCLILGFCRNKDMDGAKRILDEMGEKGVKADFLTYNVLINALCKDGEAVKAVKLLDEMVEIGVRPTYVTYSTLIDGFCEKDNNLRAAFNMRARMEKDGKQANVVTYMCLSSVYARKISFLNEVDKPHFIHYIILKEFNTLLMQRENKIHHSLLSPA